MLVKFTILASRNSLEVGLSIEGQNPELYETSLRNVPVKWVLSNSLTCKCSLEEKKHNDVRISRSTESKLCWGSADTVPLILMLCRFRREAFSSFSIDKVSLEKTPFREVFTLLLMDTDGRWQYVELLQFEFRLLALQTWRKASRITWWLDKDWCPSLPVTLKRTFFKELRIWALENLWCKLVFKQTKFMTNAKLNGEESV